jgi:hypothetical protein
MIQHQRIKYIYTGIERAEEGAMHCSMRGLQHIIQKEEACGFIQCF